MRLDKFLAENGLGSRAQVKQLLKKGLVLVNGRAEKSPKTQIDETADEIVEPADISTLFPSNTQFDTLNGEISAGSILLESGKHTLSLPAE